MIYLEVKLERSTLQVNDAAEQMLRADILRPGETLIWADTGHQPIHVPDYFVGGFVCFWMLSFILGGFNPWGWLPALLIMLVVFFVLPRGSLNFRWVYGMTDKRLIHAQKVVFPGFFSDEVEFRYRYADLNAARCIRLVPIWFWPSKKMIDFKSMWGFRADAPAFGSTLLNTTFGPGVFRIAGVTDPEAVAWEISEHFNIPMCDGLK